MVVEFSIFKNYSSSKKNNNFKAAHWKDALKILKLAVTRSSSLVEPPSSSSGPTSGWGSDFNASSFSDSKFFVNKELPDDVQRMQHLRICLLLLVTDKGLCPYNEP